MIEDKYAVVKLDDIVEHLAVEEKDMVFFLLRKVALAAQTLHNSYYVVNQDESYAEEVRDLILENC